MTSELFVVPLSDRVNVSTAAGGETSFTYNFPIQNAADLLVIRESAAGVQTVLTYVDDYTLTGVGEAEGGTVVPVEAATAGQKFYRIGKAVTERLTSIVRAGKYKSQALDDDLARAMIIAQEIMRDAARAWKSEYGVSGGKIYVGTSGQVATFDADGNLVGTTPVNGVSGLPAGGLAGQFLVKQSNESFDASWDTIEGGGNMLSSVYDPTGVAGDAFDMDQMVESDTAKKFTNTERNKLSGIESNATADLTGAEIKTLYEAEADTNAFDDAAVSKLAGITSGAQPNPAQADAGEIATPTETALRSYSPADVAAIAATVASGGLTPLSQLSLTAASEAIFTQFNSSLYCAYEFHFAHITPASDDWFGVQFSVDGGSNWINGTNTYRRLSHYVDDNSATIGAHRQNDNHMRLTMGSEDIESSSIGLSGKFEMQAPHLNNYPSADWKVNYFGASGYYIMGTASGWRLANAVVNAARFFCNGKNFNGLITMFGRRTPS